MLTSLASLALLAPVAPLASAASLSSSIMSSHIFAYRRTSWHHIFASYLRRISSHHIFASPLRIAAHRLFGYLRISSHIFIASKMFACHPASSHAYLRIHSHSFVYLCITLYISASLRLLCSHNLAYLRIYLRISSDLWAAACFFASGKLISSLG